MSSSHDALTKNIILVDFDDTIARENTTPGFYDFLVASSSLTDVNQDVASVYESFRAAATKATDDALADTNGTAVERLRRFGDRICSIERDAIGAAHARGLQSALVRFGVGPESFRQYSQRVTTHPGCLSALAAARSQGHDVAVISMNFFGQILQEVIYTETALHGIPVRANFVKFSGAAATIEGGIHSGVQKLTALEAQVVEFDPSGQRRVVYIGDSVQDLLCCLHSDVGILLRPKPSTVAMCESFGVRLEPIERLPRLSTPFDAASARSSAVHERTVYVATSWDEIRPHLLD